MARALVIGGTLFIGRVLVEQLLARGDEVVIMHRGRGTPYGDRVGEIRCDRNDVAAVERALRDERFDVVYDNVYDWERGTTAEQVSASALAACEGGGRYLFTSSVAVYGHGGPFDEDGPLVSRDYPNPYSVNKAESERALFALHRERGIEVSTIRPSFVYGPHNPFEREAFFWDRILADRPVIIPGDGAYPMHWVHVEDVARAAVLAATKDVAVGRAYNVAGAPPITQIEFVRLLARVAGREPNLVHVGRETLQRATGNPFLPPYYFGAYLDVPPITLRTERLKSELGFEPRPLEEGMRQTFAWYRQQKRPQPDFAFEDRLVAAAR